MTAKKIQVPESKKNELSEVMDSLITQMREDVSSYEGWSEFHNDEEGFKAYQTSVPGNSYRKVKGEATINTTMTPEDFFNYIDSKYF